MAIIAWKQTASRKPGFSVPIPEDHEIVIACEEAPIDFKWRGKDIREFIHMWENDLSLLDISKAWPGRNPDDVIMLWEHCLYKGWITNRKSGIYGRRRR